MKLISLAISLSLLAGSALAATSFTLQCPAPSSLILNTDGLYTGQIASTKVNGQTIGPFTITATKPIAKKPNVHWGIGRSGMPSSLDCGYAVNNPAGISNKVFIQTGAIKQFDTGACEIHLSTNSFTCYLP